MTVSIYEKGRDIGHRTKEAKVTGRGFMARLTHGHKTPDHFYHTTMRVALLLAELLCVGARILHQSNKVDFQRFNVGIEVSERRTARSTNQTMNVSEIVSPLDGRLPLYGAYFDILCPTGNQIIDIISMGVHLSNAQKSYPILLYGRQGTHVGFEGNLSAWDVLVNSTVVSKGFGVMTPIPASLFSQQVQIQAGGRFSFFIKLSKKVLLASNPIPGMEEGVFASDSNLFLLEGSGLKAATVLQPYRWNGKIIYQLVSLLTPNQNQLSGAIIPVSGSGPSVAFANPCVHNLSTTYHDNVGSYGNMFDLITKLDPIVINGIDINTDLLTPVSYEIYIKNNFFSADEGLASLQPWNLLVAGNTVGLGEGSPTPIPAFPPFRVQANSTIAFYITLKTADLRYQDVTVNKPDAQIGDLFVDTNELQIFTGISVGTYPLGQAFFGPRMWSGSIHYETACPTMAPSSLGQTAMPTTNMPTMMITTIPPTAAPTAFSTTANLTLSPQQMQTLIPTSLASETRSPSSSPTFGGINYGKCAETSRLPTTFEGGSGAYGSMFTVIAHDEPITITSMEIHTDFSGGAVSVMLYTKDGNFIGFENEPSAWRKIVDLQVIGNGEGRGTLLPLDSFSSINMQPNETKAIYVTLTTADLRYTKTSTPVGTAIAENEYLSINAGIGLADYPFAPASLIYTPRIFNGAVYVEHTSYCYPRSTIEYIIQVEHYSTRSDFEVAALISSTLQISVPRLLATKPLLDTLPYIRLDDVLVLPLPASCKSSRSGFTCTTVNATIALKHAGGSPVSNEIVFEMLNHEENVTNSLAVDELRVTYIGDKSIESYNEITFEGLQSKMNKNRAASFKKSLSESVQGLLSNDGVDLLFVRIDYQSLGFLSMPQGRSRQLQEVGYLSVGIFLAGKCRPPLVDFSRVVGHAVVANATAFERSLKSYDPFFSSLKNVTLGPLSNESHGAVSTVSTAHQSISKKHSGSQPGSQSVSQSGSPSGSSSRFPLWAVLGPLLGSLVICVACLKRREARKNRENILTANVDAFDIGKHDETIYRGYSDSAHTRTTQDVTRHTRISNTNSSDGASLPDDPREFFNFNGQHIPPVDYLDDYRQEESNLFDDEYDVDQVAVYGVTENGCEFVIRGTSHHSRTINDYREHDRGGEKPYYTGDAAVNNSVTNSRSQEFFDDADNSQVARSTSQRSHGSSVPVAYTSSHLRREIPAFNSRNREYYDDVQSFDDDSQVPRSTSQRPHRSFVSNEQTSSHGCRDVSAFDVESFTLESDTSTALRSRSSPKNKPVFMERIDAHDVHDIDATSNSRFSYDRSSFSKASKTRADQLYVRNESEGNIDGADENSYYRSSVSRGSHLSTTLKTHFSQQNSQDGAGTYVHRKISTASCNESGSFDGVESFAQESEAPDLLQNYNAGRSRPVEPRGSAHSRCHNHYQESYNPNLRVCNIEGRTSETRRACRSQTDRQAARILDSRETEYDYDTSSDDVSFAAGSFTSRALSSHQQRSYEGDGIRGIQRNAIGTDAQYDDAPSFAADSASFFVEGNLGQR